MSLSDRLAKLEALAGHAPQAPPAERAPSRFQTFWKLLPQWAQDAAILAYARWFRDRNRDDQGDDVTTILAHLECTDANDKADILSAWHTLKWNGRPDRLEAPGSPADAIGPRDGPIAV